jgi:hypothetical protein
LRFTRFFHCLEPGRIRSPLFFQLRGLSAIIAIRSTENRFTIFNLRFAILGMACPALRSTESEGLVSECFYSSFKGVPVVEY